MNPKIFKGKKGPEKKLQEQIEAMLRIKGWYVNRTHGNMYQSGFPDIFSCHTRYGQRWVEVKLPDMQGSVFTPSQLEEFPKMCANGSGVWVLTGTSESEYDKLFKPHNWWQYLDTFKSVVNRMK